MNSTRTTTRGHRAHGNRDIDAQRGHITVCCNATLRINSSKPSSCHGCLVVNQDEIQMLPVPIFEPLILVSFTLSDERPEPSNTFLAPAIQLKPSIVTRTRLSGRDGILISSCTNNELCRSEEPSGFCVPLLIPSQVFIIL